MVVSWTHAGQWGLRRGRGRGRACSSSDSIRAVLEAKEEEGEAVPFLGASRFPRDSSSRSTGCGRRRRGFVSVEASAGSTADEHRLRLSRMRWRRSVSVDSAADLGEMSGRRAEFVDQALRGANEASVKRRARWTSCRRTRGGRG